MQREKGLRTPGLFEDLLDNNVDQGMADFVDMTPRAFACEISASCPAALHSSARKSYAIIGGTIEHRNEPALKTRVAAHETAVEISEKLINEAVISTILKEATAVYLIIILYRLLLALMIRPTKFLLLLSFRLLFVLMLRPLAYFSKSLLNLMIWPIKGLSARRTTPAPGC